MDVKAHNTIPSGIEPVDKLMGGLEMGQLYLVHGEASGKSLFGIKFLIEGLKRGENGALVIRYSPEDAVRRFARLGYDCLEDVYSGRLVILEYSDDIIQQIARLRQITPVLRELEWLLGETRPERLIFDPVTNLVVGESGNLEPRVREFAEWARSFGATVVLIANTDKEEVVESFRPLVGESFRFEVKENGERATRFMAFEKTAAIPDQAIEVDPSRGLFLLGRAQTPEHFFSVFSAPPPADAALKGEGLIDRAPAQSTSTSSTDEPTIAKSPLADYDFDKILEPLASMKSIAGADINSPPQAADPARGHDAAAERGASNETVEPDTTGRVLATSRLDRSMESGSMAKPAEPSLDVSETSQQGKLNETTADVFFDLFDDLSLVASPPDTDGPTPRTSHLEAGGKAAQPVSGSPAQQSEPGEHQSHSEATPAPEGSAGARPRASVDRDAPQPRRRNRASDQKIDSAIAARAVELLLRPPESEMLTPPSLMDMQGELRPAAQATAPAVPTSVQPKDFNVLIIDDDPNSSDLIAQALTEYTVEVVHDGVSGIAKLISFKPDLVILNVDLPIIDGFKVLEHIRLSLNMPIIIVSGSRVRASDRLLAAELGADYYLTKPFSVKELRHKARQLIARYRGISSWIINARMSTNEPAPHKDRPEQDSVRLIEPLIVSIGSEGDQFTPYQEFTAQIDKRVKAAIENGAAFSVVGCRLPSMTAKGGQVALRLFELVRTLVRDTDLISTNPRNDLVVLLANADASGSRAFASRLRERATEDMHQEPSIWMRSFPDLEEATEVTASSFKPANGNKRNRRSSDARGEGDKAQPPYPVRAVPPQPGEQSAGRRMRDEG